MKHDSERSGPEPLGEILSRLFTARGWGRRGERQRLEAAWNAAVGDAIAARTRIGSLKRGVLEIEVGNGVLMQELASFRKRKLLDDLKAKLPDTPLRELKFRAGVI